MVSVSRISIDHIEACLMELTAQLPPDPPRIGPGRPRILPSALLWIGLVVCVLQGWSSQRAVWRLLATTGLWRHERIPVSDEAVYQRLEADGTAGLETLFGQLSMVLAARLDAVAPDSGADLAPFAPAVVAMDRTTLDPVLRTMPSVRDLPRGDDALLPGSLHGVFDLRRQQWRALRYTDQARQNEKVHARELVADLPVGSLLLIDRGYFGFHLLDDLTDAGFAWIMRAPAKVSLRCLHTHYQAGETLDALVEMGIHRSDRAKHAVRLVTFVVGTTRYRYLTNVRDPQRLTATEIARLYGRRWDIEMAFQLVKQHLGLSLLWSAKPTVVLQQVWAVLVIAQIVQALRLEIAVQAGVDPFDVSLPLLVTWLPRLAARGVDPVATVVSEGRHLGFIRPSRRKPPPDPGIDPGALVPAPPDLVLERVPRYRPRPTPRPQTPN